MKYIKGNMVCLLLKIKIASQYPEGQLRIRKNVEDTYKHFE